jgi:choline dehydrogenase-like flavoprotein
MSDPFELVVVGTGPTGQAFMNQVAVTGRPVLWLDAGYPASPSPLDEPYRLYQDRMGTYHHPYSETSSWAASADSRSPKLRLSVGADFTSGFDHSVITAVSNFNAIGTFTAGGLANVWGAFVPKYSDRDLGSLAVSAAELDASYKAIASFMPISGEDQSEFSKCLGADLPLSAPFASSPLFQQIKKHWKQESWSDLNNGFQIGLPRLAASATPATDHLGCSLCGACLWGCGRNVIWDGRTSLRRIGGKGHVMLRQGIELFSIGRHEDGYILNCLDVRTQAPEQIFCKRLVLATGVLSTTRLTAPFRVSPSPEVRLLSTPALAFALIQPLGLGRALPKAVHGLAQMAFSQAIDDFEAFGALYDGAAVPANEIAQAMPFTRPNADWLTRTIMPALAIGLVYLPSEFSDNKIFLSRNKNRDNVGLSITGATAAAYNDISKKLIARLRRQFMRLGLIMLPGSVQDLNPGAECHYGGTLPMGVETTKHGELIGANGIYIADASVMPRLSAKHHTFTAMALADRLGRSLSPILRESV